MSSFRILPRAGLDIEEIGLYIAQDSPDAAMRIANRLYELFQVVAENPMMGQSQDDLALGLRSFPTGNYLIFYRPIENGIEVVRVLNASRDIGSLF